MLRYEDALSKVLANICPLSPVTMDLRGCAGAICAEEIVSDIALPPFANSAMDGYAIRHEDTSCATGDAPVRLRVIGETPAGAAPKWPVESQTAVRLFTGSSLPRLATAVVPVEDVALEGDEITIRMPVEEGQFVREAGTDVAPGDTVVGRGSLIRPAEIAIAAAAGIAQIRIYPPPIVTIVSSGDELVVPGEKPLGEAQIYESNSFALAAMSANAGANVRGIQRARDNMPDLTSALGEAVAHSQVVITSGGVSVGDHDLVKAAFSGLGEIDFWRVAIRPGKPFAFGTYPGGVFFGLPGNPASAMVTFELFVHPALLKMRGFTSVHRPRVEAVLTQSVSHQPGRRSFVRARTTLVGSRWQTQPAGLQGSHLFGSMVRGNSLMIIDEEIETMSAGDTASTLLLDDTWAT